MSEAPRIERKYGLDGLILDNKSWTKVGNRRLRLDDNGEIVEVYYQGWVVWRGDGDLEIGFSSLAAAKAEGEKS